MSKEKTYYDWRGVDTNLQSAYKGHTSLVTYFGGSTFVPVQQTTPVVPEGK